MELFFYLIDQHAHVIASSSGNNIYFPSPNQNTDNHDVDKGVKMQNGSKLQIYKGMIQYLLESTSYSLKNIAALTSSSIKHIHLIYFHDYIPPRFASEFQLIKLYQIILEININKKKFQDYCPQKCCQ